MRQKGLTPIAIILIVVLVGGIMFVLMQSLIPQNLGNDVLSMPTYLPSPTTDTTDWATYEISDFGVSFQYPSEWNVSENDKNFFVISPGSVAGQSAISVDARNSENIDQTIETIKGGLTDITQTAEGDKIIIKGTVGPGFGQGTKTVTAVFKYGSTVFVVETVADTILEENLYKILSTFKFTNPSATCFPRPACLDENPACSYALPDGVVLCD